MLDILLDALRSSVLISGMVVVMMLLIESFNIESHGRIFTRLSKSGPLQVVVSALLGAVPGCVGGIAAVSLYTHRMLSFGALVAMMIATAGDETFMMLAMFPGKAILLLAILLCLAIVTGLVIDKFDKGRKPLPTRLKDTYEIHGNECHFEGHHLFWRKDSTIHYGWKRIALIFGVLAYLTALLAGLFDEGHESPSGMGLLDEKWAFWVFAVVSIVGLLTIRAASDHFIEHHLWEHIICRHLPGIFAWTFGVLLAIGILFHFIDLSDWISNNTPVMILLAIAVGLIPESGPHLIFVTLFASGVIPFPVLLANSIVQEGHASLPLLADSKSAFLKAKAIKVGIALIVFLVWGLLL